jgi:hypothetical protein
MFKYTENLKAMTPVNLYFHLHAFCVCVCSDNAFLVDVDLTGYKKIIVQSKLLTLQDTATLYFHFLLF